MGFAIRKRLGFGLDIEANEDICYRARFEDDEGNAWDEILCYNGLLIKIPFFTIYIGEFFSIEDAAPDE
jgi:hypothetical protein